MEYVFEASVKLMRVFIEDMIHFPIIQDTANKIKEKINEVLE